MWNIAWGNSDKIEEGGGKNGVSVIEQSDIYLSGSFNQDNVCHVANLCKLLTSMLCLLCQKDTEE